jgi:hypothetical protein
MMLMMVVVVVVVMVVVMMGLECQRGAMWKGDREERRGYWGGGED